MKSFVKLTEVSESCAEHSFCKVVDGVVRPIDMLGRESRSGSSMSVTHTEENPVLLIRVTDFLLYGTPKNISCGIVMGVNCPVVIVSDDTHCHTANYDVLKYQITNSGECQRLLKEFWKLRDSQEVPNQQDRSERFGEILGEGLRRATRPWLVEAPRFIQNQCITHGEFTGLMEKADRIYQLNSEDFKKETFHRDFYTVNNAQVWLISSGNKLLIVEKYFSPMYRLSAEKEVEGVLRNLVINPFDISQEVSDEETIEIVD